MPNTNRISISFGAEDFDDITAAILLLKKKLLPYLVTLSAADRRELPKMGDKTVSFVQKSQEYCKQNPDLVPPFLDVNALNIDVTAFKQLRVMYQPLMQITDSL